MHRKDIEELMFNPDGDVMKMMKLGNYAMVGALIYNYLFWPGLENGDNEWISR